MESVFQRKGHHRENPSTKICLEKTYKVNSVEVFWSVQSFYHQETAYTCNMCILCIIICVMCIYNIHTIYVYTYMHTRWMPTGRNMSSSKQTILARCFLWARSESLPWATTLSVSQAISNDPCLTTSHSSTLRWPPGTTFWKRSPRDQRQPFTCQIQPSTLQNVPTAFGLRKHALPAATIPTSLGPIVLTGDVFFSSFHARGPCDLPLCVRVPRSHFFSPRVWHLPQS